MTEKKIGKYWFYWGRTSGFALGFAVDKYHWSIDLGLFYIGQEF
jgi:hypothetical protein|tara:strand:- start:4847 stop:4978 length:132 start_codon:yes stop_codon:yes gene_type:complete